MGGKTVFNTGGKIVDYLVKNRITSSVALVEIKTPARRCWGKITGLAFTMCRRTYQARYNKYCVSASHLAASGQIC